MCPVRISDGTRRILTYADQTANKGDAKMRLLWESLEVIRNCADRRSPSNQFTVVMTLSSLSPDREFTDENSVMLAKQVMNQLSNNDDGELKIEGAEFIQPMMRTDEVLQNHWFIDWLLPQVGLTTAGFIQNHGQGQHDIRRTVKRLHTLERRRQWWMVVKWVAYSITGFLVAAWATAQLFEKFFG